MYGIFAMIGAIGAIATSLLPETYMQPLLECTEDIQHLKHHSFFSFRVWKAYEEDSDETECEKLRKIDPM